MLAYEEYGSTSVKSALKLVKARAGHQKRLVAYLEPTPDRRQFSVVRAQPHRGYPWCCRSTSVHVDQNSRAGQDQRPGVRKFVQCKHGSDPGVAELRYTVAVIDEKAVVQ